MVPALLCVSFVCLMIFAACFLALGLGLANLLAFPLGLASLALGWWAAAAADRNTHG